MKSFIEFVRTQGVVGLAIGFILGQSVSGVVNSLVTDLINPLIGLLLGRFGDLSKLSFSIGASTLTYGHFISIIINFIIVAAVVYFGFKLLKLEKLDLKKDK